jgi:hypothetical protein
VSAAGRLFRFVQVEVPWPLGPPAGRYLLRAAADADGPATHILVLALLGAAQRRRLAALRRAPSVAAQPEPAPVPTSRATVIEVAEPLADSDEASRWLAGAGEAELLAGLSVLNRALHAFRIAAADPHVHAVGRAQTLVARVGYGDGDQVAEGRWTQAREISASPTSPRRHRRAAVLEPQARLAALLGGHGEELVAEELTLRARLDLESDLERQAALGVLVALDAAIAELGRDRHAAEFEARLSELRAQRDPIGAAAQTALTATLSEDERTVVGFTLTRLEAALRARALVDG